jgi:hypothetical protein
LRVLDAAGIYRRLMITGGPTWRLADIPDDYEPEIDVGFSELEARSIDDYLRMRPDQSADEIRDRFGRGDVCVVARHDGRVVGATWIAPRMAWVEYIDCVLPLAEGVVYIYDSYVHREYRNKRVIHNMGRHNCDSSLKLGGVRYSGAVWDRNRLALDLHERSGPRVQGQITRLQLGPWRRIRVRHEEGVEPLYFHNDGRWFDPRALE